MCIEQYIEHYDLCIAIYNMMYWYSRRLCAVDDGQRNRMRMREWEERKTLHY